MPITKEKKKREPLWKEWDRLAQKKGIHHAVRAANGDTYTGDWYDNKKNGKVSGVNSKDSILRGLPTGKGNQVWSKTGAVYDGDWKDDKRHGYGVYSVMDSGALMKEYAGGWKNDKKHGYGTNYYSADEYYEGEWYAGKRSGWGRMYYTDGSIYEGEWYNDCRHGNGLLRLANDNRFEGCWANGMKNGAGKFIFLDKGQILSGHWKDDIAKCGSLEDFDRLNAPNPPVFPIPECELKDPNDVVSRRAEELTQ